MSRHAADYDVFAIAASRRFIRRLPIIDAYDAAIDAALRRCYAMLIYDAAAMMIPLRQLFRRRCQRRHATPMLMMMSLRHI